MMRKLILSMLLCLSLVGCSEIEKEYSKINYNSCSEHVIVEYPYRLWYGIKFYQFVDIVSLHNPKFDVIFEDKSWIEDIYCSPYTGQIHIYKKDSVWILNNTKEESKMTLQLIRSRKEIK